MPFDGGNFFEGGGNWPRTLNDVLKVLNIKPISRDRFIYKKIREQKRHTEKNVWHTHRHFIKAFLVGSSLIMFASMVWIEFDMLALGILGVLGYITMMLAIAFAPTPPPEWSEYRAYYLTPANKVPNNIIDQYDAIRKYLPSATVSIGRLTDYQDNMLATYVAVAYENNSAVIGFWR